MAVNINLPRGLDDASRKLLDMRSNFIHAMLHGAHTMNLPPVAVHENQLFDNAVGFRPHTFSPNDFGTG